MCTEMPVKSFVKDKENAFSAHKAPFCATTLVCSRVFSLLYGMEVVSLREITNHKTIH